jgi:hypothetical protein
MARALPDAVVTTAGTPITVNVLANDAGTDLVITSFSNPANGSLVFNADKSFTYTPLPGFLGEDGFTYTIRDGQGSPAAAEVTISVIANDGMTIAVDDAVEMTAGSQAFIPVLANDLAAGSAPLQLIAVSMPSHGAVNVLPDQTIRYVPQSGYTGIDSFTYSVVDGQGGQASATVTIKVLAANNPPKAVADSFTVNAGATTLLAVLANDSDPDGGALQIIGFTMPSHGTLAFNADKTFSYTPDSGYLGHDQFTYTIRDNHGASATAEVSLEIVEVMEPPVAVADSVTTQAGAPVTIQVLANDILPAGQQIKIVALTLPYSGKLVFNPDNTFTYTPNAGFIGIDDFSYTIGNDKGAASKATVTVEVTPEIVVPMPPAPPPPDDGNGTFIGTLTVPGVCEWVLALNGSAGAEIVNVLPESPIVVGEVVFGQTIAEQPAMDNDQRYRSRAFDRARARATGIAVPAGGIGALFQTRPPLTTSIVVARRPSFTEPGGMAINYTSSGKVEVYLALPGSTYVVLETPDGVIEAGRTYLVAATYGAAGAKLYVGNPESAAPATPIVTAPSTATISGNFPLDIAANFNNSAALNGAVGYVWGYATQPADSHFSTLIAAMRPRVRAVQEVTIVAAEGATTLLDPAPNALSGGSMTFAVTQQPGNAALAVVDGKLQVTGAVAGSDSSTARYTGTENGMTTEAATVRVIGAVSEQVAAPGTLRGATGIVVCYDADYGFGSDTQNWYGLRTAQQYLTKYAYAPPGQMTTQVGANGSGWLYDHSTAGINAGGDKLGKLAEAKYNQRGTKIVWVNIEQWHSMNVPDPLTDGTRYSSTTDGFFANTDYITQRTGLRAEVVRFRTGIIARAKQYVADKGLGFIEFADYNYPRKFNLNERAILSTDSRIVWEAANASGFIDLIDATGPQCQLLVREVDRERMVSGTGTGLTQAQCIEWFVNGVRTRLQAYAAAGKTIRVMPCVWPVIFVQGSSTHSALRPGMMTTMMNELYGLGVRRFITFQWTGIASVFNNTTERALAHAAHEELAEWILARSSQMQVI